MSRRPKKLTSLSKAARPAEQGLREGVLPMVGRVFRFLVTLGGVIVAICAIGQLKAVNYTPVVGDVEKQTSDGVLTVEGIQKLRAEQARKGRIYRVIFWILSIPLIVPMVAGIFLVDYEWFTPIFEAFFKYFKWFALLYFVGMISLWPLLRREASIQRQLEDARLGITKISSELPDDLESKLIALNLKYQDRYYLETGLQANKSFYASLAVAVLGFMMVCVAIVLFFYEKIPTAAATVSVAAGTITEFISAVFFYLFNKTVLSMASYHQRLLFTQNVALSLKLVHALPEDKRQTLIEMIVAELMRDLNLHLGGIQTDRMMPGKPSEAVQPSGAAQKS